MKHVKRLQHELTLKRIKFLKNIEFISGWQKQDIESLNSLLKLENIIKSGTNIIEEGHQCKKIIIVKSGEFLITKRDFNNVYINSNSGLIKINYSNGNPVYSSKLHHLKKSK